MFIITANMFSMVIAAILLFAFFVLKFVIAIIIACQFSHNRVSKFDKKY